MTSLPKKQTLYVSIDAINHVIEAATTKISNPLDVLLAKETIRLVVKYIPKAIENPNDIEKLTNLVFETPSLALLISVAPVDGTKDIVKQIYTDSF